MRRAVLALLLLASTGWCHGQVDRVVTAAMQGYSISGLVSQLEAVRNFKHGIALFPGHPGIMQLTEINGQPRFDMRGNFLVRSRRHWLDQETLVAVIDAPSDEWMSFPQSFRDSPRYGADVASLIEKISQIYSVEDWTFVGTSEGSVSAFHAARMNPQLARRVILTSSLWGPTRIGRGLSNAKFEELAAPLLWVHHEDDPCRFTSYRQAKQYAERTRRPLVTVRGGGPEKGDPCQAFSSHGFVGVEREVVLAMRSWVKTGVVPGDVSGASNETQPLR